MTYFRGTKSSTPSPRIGWCLTTDEDAAAKYARGAQVFAFSFNDSGLVVVDVEVSREDMDENNWPGDTVASIAALVAQGYDAVTYLDMDESGRTHPTLRLLTPAAVAALTVR